MYVPGKHDELLYVLVSIKIHIGNHIHSVHYVYDVLDYKTWTCWNCYDNTITKYSGYPYNVYDNLSKWTKRGDFLLWMDQIGFFQCYT